MATSSAAVKLRRLRRRFGIGAPRVAIRTHIAWYWRVLAGLLGLAVLLALIVWVYDIRAWLPGYDNSESMREIQALRNHVMELDSELTKLRGVTGSEESRLQIQQATLQRLSDQVKELGLENAALKQDLAFFEELMPSAEMGDKEGFKINHLRIEPENDSGGFRYQMLAVYNGGRQSQAKTVQGDLRLIVKMRHNGKDVTLSLPADKEEKSERFHFEIKSLQRLDGVFSVPQGAVLKSVEAQLLQNGTVRAKQLVTL